jgi:ankyrin repeat protein
MGEPRCIRHQKGCLKDGSVIRLLLEHNTEGSTLLHWASLCGAPEVVRLMIEDVADVLE